MIGRLFTISLLLVTFVSAQDINQFLAKIEADRYAENVCTGKRFARNTRGCSWFWVCDDDGEKLEQNRCPENFFFSEEDQLCDKRENVECMIPDPPTVCPSESGVVVISHPNSCSKYTVCFDGIQNDRVCAPGLHFSYYDGDCVDPFLADCQADYKTCQKSVETGLPAVVADDRDCRAYYVCFGGNSVLLMCAPGSHFDSNNNWCVAPQSADCTPAIPPNQPSIPDKISMDCEGRSGVAMPHPESCEFFFFCAGDRSYLQICGIDLIFDVTTRRCQPQETALCILEEDNDPPAPEGP